MDTIKSLPLIDIETNKLNYVLANTEKSFVIYRNGQDVTTFPPGFEDEVPKDSIQMIDILV